MTKKEYVMGIIDTLQQQQDLLPQNLQQLLRETKETLQSIPAETFFKHSNHVVSEPARQKAFDPDSPLFRLSEGYWELRRLAERNRESHPDFLQAVNQLDGLLGASEGYFPE
ncbi:hypothetical protein KDJ56_07670 [Brevibacillus composti]|uniref:Uncharacterized protein n=1 Tax=Brevibacillus composti TaxID=2796470 RepID=A0A7T5ENH1_9BACL|nr:hypothetical protein [Brevibacillus composti]QQE75801.1 hypothetical protein JD108_07990 [Brevibacillus composti]QUO42827.1 hypothetical protein KDJ56_07670 [Brevibacillus composti]